jgi:diguanylate cyclase (GGDEF)-like protein
MPDFPLDIKTLYFAVVLVTILMSAIMVFVWRVQKTYEGTRYWVLSNVACSAGFLLLNVRGILPEFVSLVFAGVLSFGTLALALEGTRRFLGLRPNTGVTIGILAAHLASLVIFTYVTPSQVARMIVSSAVASCLSFLCFKALSEKPAEHQSGVYRAVGYTFLLFSVLMFARMVAALSLTNFATVRAPVWLQIASAIMFLVFATLWSFSYIVLNSERLNEELRLKEAELIERAATDFLTGLANKRSFLEFAAAEIKRSRRYQLPATIVLLDLDNFKKVNDTHGHSGGDTVLREVGALLKSMTREHDRVARLGGEEFGLFLTHADAKAGAAVAENLRKAIRELSIAHSAIEISVTSSFGVAELRRNDSLEAIMDRADANLYKAKNLGRNCVVTDATGPLRLISQA